MAEVDRDSMRMCRRPRTSARRLDRRSWGRKDAVLELIRRAFCEHVVVLPEAAGILFGGPLTARTTMTIRFGWSPPLRLDGRTIGSSSRGRSIRTGS